MSIRPEAYSMVPAVIEKKKVNMKKFKKVNKPVSSYLKKGVRLTGVAAGITGAAYVAGAGSRRYKKAPKPGEGRKLRSEVLSKPDKRTYYL